MLSLEKVLQDTRKVKVKYGRHFNKPWPSCGSTVHLFSTLCTIHRWVVRVTLYPIPYAHRIAGCVGQCPGGCEEENVRCRWLPTASSPIFQPIQYLCELHSRQIILRENKIYSDILFLFLPVFQTISICYIQYSHQFYPPPLRTVTFSIKIGIDISEFH